ARTRSRSAPAGSNPCSSPRPRSKTASASSTVARSSPASPPERRGSLRCWPGKCRSRGQMASALSSQEATSPPRQRLLSWPGDEGRHPPRIRARDGSLRLREYLPDPLDEAGAARRDLLELPPVLHGQAEARPHRRPGGALPAPPRAGAGREAVVEN